MDKIKDWIYFHRELLLLIWNKDIPIKDDFLVYILSHYKWNLEMEKIRENKLDNPKEYNNIIDKLIKDQSGKYINKFNKNTGIKLKDLFN